MSCGVDSIEVILMFVVFNIVWGSMVFMNWKLLDEVKLVRSWSISFESNNW